MGSRDPAPRWRRRLVRAVAGVLAAQVVVTAGLIAWAWPWPAAPDGDGLAFRGLPDEPDPAPRQPYQARDGATLSYRAYPAAGGADTIAIALHGSGTDSRYLAPLARSLARRGAAHVVTPDLRGHGPDPQRRGDVDDPAQLERDLAALAAHVEQRWDASRLVVVGHSSGGGLAARMAGGPHGELVDGFALLAPYLGHDAPSSRAGSGGWAHANVGRIAVIETLAAVGVDGLADHDVLRFRMPPAQRDGYETLAYTHRMMTALEPRDWRAALSDAPAPVLILAGTDDDAMRPRAYAERIAPATGARVALIDGAGHLDLVTDARVTTRLTRFVSATG